MRKGILIFSAFTFAAVSAVANANTITVNDAGDAGPGNCASTCTLRDAIASAATGDTINFALAAPATITLDSQELLIYKSLNIVGPGADQLTISAAGQSRVFEIANAATVSIESLAVRDGQVVGIPGAEDYSGTAIPGTGGGAQGGAIYVGVRSGLSLADCDIHDNTAIGGPGGIETNPSSSVSGGSGGLAEGGAVYAAGDVVASHCTFRANSAVGGHGGDNQAVVPGTGAASGGTGGDGHGGAIAGSGTVEMIDVTLAGNSASGGSGGSFLFPVPGSAGGAGGNASGGALSIAGFSVFEFVTSAANSAVAGGGGFGMLPGSIGSATASDLLLAATVVARSTVFGSATAPACTLVTGGIQAQGANLDRDGSCPGFTLHTDPMLAPLAPNVGARYVMFPQSGSPLIDAAINCQDAFGTTVTDDELGTQRPQGAKCDLGAVEADYIFVDGFGG